MYIDRMPDVAYRAAYPTARLTAAVKNLMGGKDPNATEGSFDPNKYFSPEEELPWFAKNPEQRLVDPELAKAIIASRTKLPRWARALLNWEALEREAASGMR